MLKCFFILVIIYIYTKMPIFSSLFQSSGGTTIINGDDDSEEIALLQSLIQQQLNTINATVDTKANISSTYTKSEVDALVGTNDYNGYTTEQTDALLNAKANISTTYTKEQVDALVGTNEYNGYTTTQTDALLNTKANISTTYTKEQVDALVGTNDYNGYTTEQTDALLNAKANISTTYTKSEVDGFLSQKTTLTDVYSSIYTKTETDNKYQTKASLHDFSTTLKVGSSNFQVSNNAISQTVLNLKNNASSIGSGSKLNFVLNTTLDNYINNISTLEYLKLSSNSSRFYIKLGYEGGAVSSVCEFTNTNGNTSSLFYGPITCATTATGVNHLTNKNYVDNAINASLMAYKTTASFNSDLLGYKTIESFDEDMQNFVLSSDMSLYQTKASLQDYTTGLKLNSSMIKAISNGLTTNLLNLKNSSNDINSGCLLSLSCNDTTDNISLNSGHIELKTLSSNSSRLYIKLASPNNNPVSIIELTNTNNSISALFQSIIQCNITATASNHLTNKAYVDNAILTATQPLQTTANVYTKTQIDAMMDEKIDLSGNYTADEINDNFQLKDDMVNYYNKTQADDKFQLITNMSNYSLTSTISSTYQTIAGMSLYQPLSSMSLYQTVEGMINYLPKHNFSATGNSTINNLILTTGTILTTPSGNLDITNKIYVDNALSNYYTKAQADGKYQLISDMANYYTKTQSDLKYQLISDMSNYSLTSTIASLYATKLNSILTGTTTINNAILTSGSIINTPSANNDITNKNYVDDGLFLKANKLNAVLTGNTTINNLILTTGTITTDASGNYDIVNKKYIDDNYYTKRQIDGKYRSIVSTVNMNMGNMTIDYLHENENAYVYKINATPNSAFTNMQWVEDVYINGNETTLIQPGINTVNIQYFAFSVLETLGNSVYYNTVSFGLVKSPRKHIKGYENGLNTNGDYFRTLYSNENYLYRETYSNIFTVNTNNFMYNTIGHGIEESELIYGDHTTENFTFSEDSITRPQPSGNKQIYVISMYIEKSGIYNYKYLVFGLYDLGENKWIYRFRNKRPNAETYTDYMHPVFSFPTTHDQNKIELYHTLTFDIKTLFTPFFSPMPETLNCQNIIF